MPALFGSAAAGTCAHLNLCSGHGTCDAATSKCACFNGWGSTSDIASYKSPDCSMSAWLCGAVAWHWSSTVRATLENIHFFLAIACSCCRGVPRRQSVG